MSGRPWAPSCSFLGLSSFLGWLQQFHRPGKEREPPCSSPVRAKKPQLTFVWVSVVSRGPFLALHGLPWMEGDGCWILAREGRPGVGGGRASTSSALPGCSAATAAAGEDFEAPEALCHLPILVSALACAGGQVGAHPSQRWRCGGCPSLQVL